MASTGRAHGPLSGPCAHGRLNGPCARHSLRAVHAVAGRSRFTAPRDRTRENEPFVLILFAVYLQQAKAVELPPRLQTYPNFVRRVSSI